VAQIELELEPAIGVYAGFSSFTRPTPPTPFVFPDTPLSQRTSVAFGGQAMAWLGSHVALRAHAFSAPSEVGPEAHGLHDLEPVPARVTTVGLDALVRVAGLPTGGRVFLAGGAVLIRRSGQAYEGFKGLGDVGGTLGVGSQFRLTDRLSLQADFRTLLYQLRLTDPDGLEYPSEFQTDVLGHVGIVFRLAGPNPEVGDE
jgi:hypothetical protein